ncbi:MAG TPA: hypothetical protein VGK65_09330 [Candidatus Binatia bacterium]
MATNRGACRSETAGTATLMTFRGTSAENVGVSSDSKNAVRKIRLVHRFIVAPGLIRLSPDYSKPEKKSSWIRHPSSLAHDCDKIVVAIAGASRRRNAQGLK